MANATPHFKRPAHVERIALVLQGGGALGAYQAGAYEALHAAGCGPDWVSGISIGAINAAIIAGNTPDRRLERLKQFWETVTTTNVGFPTPSEGMFRIGFNQLSASSAALLGVPGFYRPRFSVPWWTVPGSDAATSLYDASPLRATLLELVDFDLIGSGSIRLTVTAVDVESGNSVVFDSSQRRLSVDHIMASAALPPSFAAVEIDGRHYWDGGILSNAPINTVLDDDPRHSTLAFQIDLFNQRGYLPRTLDEVVERQKDIGYSSRTRFNTDRLGDVQEMRRAIAEYLDTLPEAKRNTPAIAALARYACDSSMTVVHLIYRHRAMERHSKDFEFSRTSMQEHWQSGLRDVSVALEHKSQWLAAPKRHEAFRAFDFTQKPDLDSRHELR